MHFIIILLATLSCTIFPIHNRSNKNFSINLVAKEIVLHSIEIVAVQAALILLNNIKIHEKLTAQPTTINDIVMFDKIRMDILIRNYACLVILVTIYALIHYRSKSESESEIFSTLSQCQIVVSKHFREHRYSVIEQCLYIIGKIMTDQMIVNFLVQQKSRLMTTYAHRLPKLLTENEKALFFLEIHIQICIFFIKNYLLYIFINVFLKKIFNIPQHTTTSAKSMIFSFYYSIFIRHITGKLLNSYYPSFGDINLYKNSGHFNKSEIQIIQAKIAITHVKTNDEAEKILADLKKCIRKNNMEIVGNPSF